MKIIGSLLTVVGIILAVVSGFSLKSANDSYNDGIRVVNARLTIDEDSNHRHMVNAIADDGTPISEALNAETEQDNVAYDAARERRARVENKYSDANTFQSIFAKW